MIDRPDNINIFILYAKEDQALKQELEDHLGLLQRLGYIDVWHEGQVQPGVEKEEVVSAYLEKAHIILLLISANFLAPDHYMKYEAELRLAYDRQKNGDVIIIPVILRHCVWQLDFLAGLNPLPLGGHPVRSNFWESIDNRHDDVTLALQKVAADIKGKMQPAPQTDEQAEQPPQSKPAINTFMQPVAEPVSESPIRAGNFQELLDGLFRALFALSKEEALHAFVPLAHRSLVTHGKLDDYFRQHNFEVAHTRIRQYSHPPTIVAEKPTGRRRIGPRNDKDEGEEVVVSLARVNETGGMPGQVRIFRSALDGKISISGLSL